MSAKPLITEEALVPDEITIRRHLTMLTSPYDHGQIEICGIDVAPDAEKRVQARHFDLNDIRGMAQYAVSLNARRGVNVYVGPAVRENAPSNRRAKKEHVSETRWVWIDCDSEGDVGRVSELLGTEDLKPEFWVTTGTLPHQRAQAFIRLDRGVPENSRVTKILAGLAARFDTDRSVVNPDRVMRLAGSIAYAKPNKPGRIDELTTLDRLSSVTEHTPDSLETQFPAPDNTRRKTDASRSVTPKLQGTIEHSGDPFEIPRLCDLFRRTSVNELDRADFIRVVMAAKHAGGDALRTPFLEWAARFEGSDPAEDERIWDTAKPNGDVSVGTLYHLLAPDMSLLDLYLQRYVHVAAGDRVVDLHLPPSAGAQPRREFEAAKANVLVSVGMENEQKPVSKVWLTDRRRKSADNFVYAPGATRIVERRGQLFVNTYECPNWPHGWPEKATKAPPQEFEEILELLFPDEGERMMFKQWLAHTIWRPKQRSPIVIILVTPEQGVGKNSLARLCCALVGQHNTAWPKTKDLTSDFNSHWEGTTLVVIDEVMDSLDGSKRFKVMDTLRDQLTETPLHVNTKHKVARSIDVFANVLFLTNHTDAIAINEKDRRLFPIVSFSRPREPEFYDRLNALQEDPEALGAIAAHLRPYADTPLPQRAPNSTGRQMMIDASRPEWEDTLDEFIEKNQGSSLSFAAVQEALGGQVQPRALHSALVRRGFENKRKALRSKENPRRIWVPVGSPFDPDNVVLGSFD